jgi:DNA-binding NarL/FixJ family response regulator
VLNGNIRILLVDDHALVRAALCERLGRQPGFEMVGSVGAAEEAINLAFEAKPDVVLMDIDMPGLSCFDAARRIAAVCPQIRFIFFSGFLTDRYIEQVLEVHARGYLTKQEPPETVVAAIRKVAAGGVFFSDEVQDRIVVDSHGARLSQAPDSPVSLLTPREREIIRYIARGLAKKEIAGIMHISAKTVDRHCANLMAKLDIHDRVELTLFAIREGLAEP